MGIAKKLIDMAALCGPAVKFQKRNVDSELSVELRSRPYENENSFGATYGEHRKFLELSWQQHQELQHYAQDKGILYLCTICDLVSLEQMMPLDLPAYKVASRDITNWPLLAALAELRRPVVLSTGMAELEDVDKAVEIIRRRHDQVAILQCTSEYPCPPEHINLLGLRPCGDALGPWWVFRITRRGLCPGWRPPRWAPATWRSISRSPAPCGAPIMPVPWKWKDCAAWWGTFARSKWPWEAKTSASSPG